MNNNNNNIFIQSAFDAYTRWHPRKKHKNKIIREKIINKKIFKINKICPLCFLLLSWEGKSS